MTADQKKEELKTPVCIIGSGPAGHTAAIYAARAGTTCVMILDGEVFVDA